MREMKDSNTVWLGKIPKTWRISKISNVYELRTQKVSDRDYIPLSVTMKGIVPQLDSVAKTNAHDDRKLVKKGDFVINSRSDRRGSCGVSDYDGSVSLINTVMKPRDEMNPDYYNWLFHTIQFADEFYKWGHGIVDDLWTTNWQDMKHIDIPVPSLFEQKKIAEYLNKIVPEIDALYTDIEKELETIEEYKKSKIEEIFEKYKDKYDYINTKLVRISKLITKQTGFDYTSYIKPSLVGEETENTLPFIQTKNFKNNYFSFDTDYFIPKDVAQKFPKIILNNKCLLFSISGASIGNVSVFPGTRDAFLGGAICKVDLIDEDMCEYVKYFVMSSTAQNYIMINIYSSAQGNITVQNVRDIKLPIFEKGVEKQITYELKNMVNEADEINNLLKKQLETIEEYKKSLIYEYVTGKKEVSI